MATKTKAKGKSRVWKFQTIATRDLADKLTKMSAEGETVFQVFVSAGTMGAFDVLSFSEKVNE